LLRHFESCTRTGVSLVGLSLLRDAIEGMDDDERVLDLMQSLVLELFALVLAGLALEEVEQVLESLSRVRGVVGIASKNSLHKLR
jgi:hypothetical protein